MPEARPSRVRKNPRGKGWDGRPPRGLPEERSFSAARSDMRRHGTQEKKHMARLRNLVIATIAVVLAVALVAYLLRPTATPTTASTTTQPPPDQTCSARARGYSTLDCSPPAAPGGGDTGGSDKGSKGDHGSDDDHCGHPHGGHGGHGHEGKDRDDRGHHGQGHQRGHSDRGHGHGDD